MFEIKRATANILGHRRLVNALILINEMEEIHMTNKETADLMVMIRRIETAILGDCEAGVEGMVKKVDRHEKQLQTIQRILWVGTGVVSVIALLWTLFKEFRS